MGMGAGVGGVGPVSLQDVGDPLVQFHGAAARADSLVVVGQRISDLTANSAGPRGTGAWRRRMCWACVCVSWVPHRSSSRSFRSGRSSHDDVAMAYRPGFGPFGG